MGKLSPIIPSISAKGKVAFSVNTARRNKYLLKEVYFVPNRRGETIFLAQFRQTTSPSLVKVIQSMQYILPHL
jgi:hypothetical protein